MIRKVPIRWPSEFSSLLLSGRFSLRRVTLEQEEPYLVSQVSLAIAKPLQSGTQIQPEQLNASPSTWPGTELAASPWWHLRKHTWGPFRLRTTFAHPRQAAFSIEFLGVLFVSLFLFFPLESVEFVSSSFLWYVSCSHLKHAGCMTNEVGVGLAKIISLFLSPVAICILITQTLPTLRPRGVF